MAAHSRTAPASPATLVFALIGAALLAAALVLGVLTEVRLASSRGPNGPTFSAPRDAASLVVVSKAFATASAIEMEAYMSILVPSWGRASSAARPAFLAAYSELVLWVILVVGATWVTIGSLLRSEEPVIFSGGKIGPQVGFIIFMAGVVAAQLGIAFALRQRTTWLRVVGVLSSGALALFGLLTVAVIVVGIVQAAVGSFSRYESEFADVIGMVIFIPIVGWLAFLNGRSALRTFRELRGRREA